MTEMLRAKNYWNVSAIKKGCHISPKVSLAIVMKLQNCKHETSHALVGSLLILSCDFEIDYMGSGNNDVIRPR